MGYPPLYTYKQQTVLKYAQRYQINILIETGTYYGAMVDAVKGEFKQIYSIELGKDLCQAAKLRFRESPEIKIICGDSGIRLKNLLKKIKEPSLFWLDAHYSGGNTAFGSKSTPILDELEHILKSKINHIILIDDARMFGYDPAYPTIEQLCDFVYSRKPTLIVTVKDDIIRLEPGENT